MLLWNSVGSFLTILISFYVIFGKEQLIFDIEVVIITRIFSSLHLLSCTCMRMLIIVVCSTAVKPFDEFHPCCYLLLETFGYLISIKLWYCKMLICLYIVLPLILELNLLDHTKYVSSNCVMKIQGVISWAKVWILLECLFFA